MTPRETSSLQPSAIAAELLDQEARGGRPSRRPDDFSRTPSGMIRADQ
jgi:hypothetical protein